MSTQRPNSSQTQTTPNLIPLDVLAQRWHTRPATLRAWIRRGVLPAVKIGALLYFDADELAKAVESRRIIR